MTGKAIRATANKPSLSKETYYHRNFNTQFFADYARTFNNVHTIGATFGLEASGQDYDNSGLSRKEYIFDVDQIGSGRSKLWKTGLVKGSVIVVPP